MRSLRRRGARVRVLPHTATASDVLGSDVDGVVLSPGPGDPGILEGPVALAHAVVSDGRPLLGQTFTTTLASAPASTAAFLSLGTSPVRFDLTVIGMQQCTLLTLPVITIPLPTSATGTASFALAMPNVAALVGGKYDEQWFALDPPATTLGLIVSSALDVTVGTP